MFKRASCQRTNAARWLMLAVAASAMLGNTASWAQAAPVAVREVSLQTQARVEVAQDWLQLRLHYSSTGSQAGDLQRDINTVLSGALKVANLASDKAQAANGPRAMRVRTGGLRVHPRHDENGRIERWQGQAELVIEGLDMTGIQEVAAKLTPFVLSRSVLSLSQAAQERAESDLMLDAIAAFRDKAKAATQAFGYSAFEIGQVRVFSDAQPYSKMPGMPPLLMAASPRQLDTAPLDIQAGWQWVSLNVSGSVTMR